MEIRMRTVLKVEGMHCRGCEALMEDILGDLGVKAMASYGEGTIKVEFDDAKINLGDIKMAIEQEGYKVL
jgi:copper chaperone CopZ